MPRLTVVGDESTSTQMAGWLKAEGIDPNDPNGDLWLDIHLWPAAGDPAGDPHTHYWYSALLSTEHHGNMITQIEAVNHQPGTIYWVFDDTRTGSSILDELGLQAL